MYNYQYNIVHKNIKPYRVASSYSIKHLLSH